MKEFWRNRWPGTTRIQSILGAIKNTEQDTFSRKEWLRLTSGVCEKKEEATYLRSYLSEHGFIEYVVRLTDKGKERLKK